MEKTTIKWLQDILVLGWRQHWEWDLDKMIEMRCDFISNAPNYVPESKLAEACICIAKGIFSDMRDMEVTYQKSIEEVHNTIFAASLIHLETITNNAISELKLKEK